MDDETVDATVECVFAGENFGAKDGEEGLRGLLKSSRPGCATCECMHVCVCMLCVGCDCVCVCARARFDTCTHACKKEERPSRDPRI